MNKKGSMMNMTNGKGSSSSSKYPAAISECQAPVLSFSTSGNQKSNFFLYFSLNRGHKNRQHTKYQLKPKKDVIGTNSGVYR